MIVFRIALAVFGFLLTAVGVVVMIAPTPFGFIVVILGLLIIANVAPGFVRWLRRRWRWLDRRLDALQQKGPPWLARILRRSDPEEDETEDTNAKDAADAPH
ncbi:MAG: hypothetical protein ACX939_12125 [Hyphococcus sp.]